ncbi:MAG: zinc ribbon domain-containing protein [Clostridia bacterium]|nr:zinc ribbon domain-containing protein [Clostridia bacterium]
MSKGDTSLIRKLVPIKWMFDLYTSGYANQVERNSRSPCTSPFFSNASVRFKSGTINTTIPTGEPNVLRINFSSFCPCQHVYFETVTFTLREFITQLEKILDRKSDYISFDVNVSTDWLNAEDCSSFQNCMKRSICKSINQLSPTSSSLFIKGSVTCVVQFKLNEVKEALAVYHGIEDNKGGFTMKGSFGKLFSGMEMGINRDPRIKSTLTGIVVQNPDNGKYYAFDPATRTRKDMLNLKLGNFPIVLVPVKNLTVGKMTKRDGKYYWVQSINDDNTFTGVNAMTGAVETFVNNDSLIPGFNFYTEVVAFDGKTLLDPSSKQNMGGNVLGAMLMMQMMNSDKAEFSLDDINDDSFNGLGMFLPMLMASKDGNLGITNPDGTPNIMMMMMLMGDGGEGGMNDFMKFSLLSNLLGGGNNANPLGDIMSGISTVVPGIAPAAAGAGHYACTICGKEFDDPEVRFCTECGGKVEAAGTVCPKCGEVLKEGAKFCHKCGAKIGADVCKACGKEIPEGAKFCPYCGEDVNGKPPAPAKPTRSKKTTAKKADAGAEAVPN